MTDGLVLGGHKLLPVGQEKPTKHCGGVVMKFLRNCVAAVRRGGLQAWAVMGVALGALLFSPSMAGASVLQAEDDAVLDAVESVQTKAISYVGPITLAIVAIGLAAIAFKLVPRVISMISARLR